MKLTLVMKSRILSGYVGKNIQKTCNEIRGVARVLVLGGKIFPREARIISAYPPKKKQYCLIS